LTELTAFSRSSLVYSRVFAILLRLSYKWINHTLSTILVTTRRTEWPSIGGRWNVLTLLWCQVTTGSDQSLVEGQWCQIASLWSVTQH
jgi:hypothetical protein